ncbi:GatB/YqeY domain-containing protein [Thalassotalea euphylliae]|uniref:GatB/YqeY domain-containing protein n=1 Tax=Thalassotalea euphylliae TaxID=1655234 RepID=A0A3E0UI11_9GAMM|nr:GatB/YqeY domain-containing protein [Thalassotalea euphylliae]REL28001.1 GatB/YqeY domain-containing protein [Thalassotalea euphylliae]REL31998.1 GatB/YqeY domain-containing protein [Thalassotalea euphylliae]REL36520.1 GatB/YqeY domain-containing protein [Thalassotalea euphylliae]
MSLLVQLKDEMKVAMRAKEKIKLGAIRMALSSIKQAEIDNKTELDDAGIIAVLTKMVKQRKESITMYTEGGREELAANEAAEVAALEAFLPTPLTDEEIAKMISDAIADTGASSMADMGKVMAVLKPAMQGKADLGAVSGKVRATLNA